VPGTKFAALQYTYNGEGFPDPTNPQKVNIQQWIQDIGLGNPSPDQLSAFDKNYDSSIGGLNTATEKMYNSQRAVPLFEFRDLDPLKTTDFESFMGTVDSSIQALHQQFITQPARKIRLRRQSDNGSCILSNTYSGSSTTPTMAAGDPDCGPNLGQAPCPTSTMPSTTTSTPVSATTLQLPAASPSCNDVEECDEDENAARPS
jgi:hypothetical protein